MCLLARLFKRVIAVISWECMITCCALCGKHMNTQNTNMYIKHSMHKVGQSRTYTPYMSVCLYKPYMSVCLYTPYMRYECLFVHTVYECLFLHTIYECLFGDFLAKYAVAVCRIFTAK